MNIAEIQIARRSLLRQIGPWHTDTAGFRKTPLPKMKAEHATCRACPTGKCISFRRCARSDFRPWWIPPRFSSDAEDRHPPPTGKRSPAGEWNTTDFRPSWRSRGSWQRCSNRAGVLRYVPAPRTARGEPSRCLADPGPSAVKLDPVFRCIPLTSGPRYARGQQTS